MTCVSFISNIVVVTGAWWGSVGLTHLSDAGTNEWRSANIEITASMAPDALVVWAVKPLVDE